MRAFLLPLFSLLPLLSLALSPGPARALDVVVGSATVARNALDDQTVFLDVWLDLAPAETPPDLAAFQVAVTLAPALPGGGLVPPAALPSGLHPAVISSNFTPDFAGSDGAARVSAVAFLDAGSTTIADGAGLMRIEVSIPAGVAGLYALDVDLDPVQGTVLADGVGSPIAFGAVSGSLDVVQNAPALSAPGVALLVLSLAAASLWGAPRPGRERG
jgi:hypothetical protein